MSLEHQLIPNMIKNNEKINVIKIKNQNLLILVLRIQFLNQKKQKIFVQ